MEVQGAGTLLCSAPRCHQYRLEYELPILPMTHRPAHEHLTPQIEHHRQIQPVLSGA